MDSSAIYSVGDERGPFFIVVSETSVAMSIGNGANNARVRVSRMQGPISAFLDTLGPLVHTNLVQISPLPFFGPRTDAREPLCSISRLVALIAMENYAQLSAQWAAPSSSPFNPTIGKEHHFKVGAGLLLIGMDTRNYGLETH